MQYRQLGESDLHVSIVSLGCNNFGGVPLAAPSGTVYGALDLAQTRAVVEAALEAGINFFDTADVYAQGGSERFLGEILKPHRREVVIATKWGAGLKHRPEIAWGSRSYIRQAIHASLDRLQTDYIDLYQLHWPDPRTPLEETIAALDELQREGKLRHVGSSHFVGRQVDDADRLSRARGHVRFVAAQNHYSLLERGAEHELIPACVRCRVSLLAYFPLENGLLTGKYGRAQRPVAGRMAGRAIGAALYDYLDALAAFAAQRGRGMVDIAIGALAANPVVGSVITGATRPEQIRANAAARWHPSVADLLELEKMARPAAFTHA